MHKPEYNWTSTGPGGCDSHNIEHPCGRCAVEAGRLSQTDAMILKTDAMILKRKAAHAAELELEEPRTTDCPQPDIDICRECGDHAHFEEEGGRLYSECCSAPPYDPDC